MSVKGLAGKEFGQLLQVARQRQGWSELKFSQELGTTTLYVTDIEKGRRGMSVASFAKAVRVLGVRPDMVIRMVSETELAPILDALGYS